LTHVVWVESACDAIGRQHGRADYFTFWAWRIIVGGVVDMSISLVWISFVQVETSYWFLLVPIMLIGFGFGLAVPAQTQVILSAPPPELAGVLPRLTLPRVNRATRWV
jgi:hypothetical protein